MYNLSEYILVKRVDHIIRQLTKSNITYRSFNSNKMLIEYTDFDFDDNKELSVQLENVIGLLFEGARAKRFVTINTGFTVPAISIILLEIYEPSHCYIPVVITNKSILLVSAFGVPEKYQDVFGNKWVMELGPTEVFRQLNASSESILSERLQEFINTVIEVNGEETHLSDIIKDVMTIFSDANQTYDKILTDNFDEKSVMDIEEVSVESKVWKVGNEQFGFESILQVDAVNVDEVISPTDFLPIQVAADDEFKYVEVLSKNGKFKLILGDGDDNREIEGVEENFGSTMAIKIPEASKNTLIIELGVSHYNYPDRALMFEYRGVVKTERLFDIIATSDEINEILSMVGTEGFIGTVKDVMSAIKILGLRKGTVLYTAIMALTKVPRKIAVWGWNALRNSIKTRNQMQKIDALDMQEKLLNDEFDIILEKIKFYSETGVRSWVWTVILGPIYLLPFVYWLKLKANKQIKVRALERLEIKLDGIMERQDAKIEACRNSGTPEELDALLAEKHNMEFARFKLLEFKKDLMGAERIRYMSFNKDLTMNSRQRIDALLQSGGYFNIGNSYGSSYNMN